jgi:hypothetical protein
MPQLPQGNQPPAEGFTQTILHYLSLVILTEAKDLCNAAPRCTSAYVRHNSRPNLTNPHDC